MKRIYLFNTVAWNYRKKIGSPVCKKENFAGLQAHRKRGKSARASPTPHRSFHRPTFIRPAPHFCRIINNFLSFYRGQLIRTENTILESSSKCRLVCLKEETTYVLPGWICGSFHFFIRTPSPPPLYGRLSYVAFVVGKKKKKRRT